MVLQCFRERQKSACHNGEHARENSARTHSVGTAGCDQGKENSILTMQTPMSVAKPERLIFTNRRPCVT
jgi:hypothetical protein